MKCGIVKSLWDSKYGDVFKTNISGAVLGAITDPDGDGKVSLNDILLGIGGAHIWKAYRAGNLSAGLSMKIEHDIDVLSEAIAEHPEITMPEKLVHTFRDLNPFGDINFIKYDKHTVRAMMQDAIDLKIDNTNHLNFWKKYRMYIPPDFGYPRLLDIHTLPGLLDLLKNKIEKSEIELFGKTIEVTQKELENSHGSAVKTGQNTGKIDLHISDSVAQRYYTFIHENQHLNQPEHLGGTSSSMIATIQKEFPGELPKDLLDIHPFALYRNNIGEAEAVYMEHLNMTLIKQANNVTLNQIDKALLENHPMVHMLNEAQGTINYINLFNITKANLETDKLLAFPTIYKVANKIASEQKLNSNEVIPYLAWKRILDNKHLEFIYQELDKPGSVKITKKNIKQFITNDITEYHFERVFNLK